MNTEIISMSKQEIRSQFEKDIKNFNTLEARLLWGLFENDDREKKINYLRILYQEEKYDELISYVKNVDVDFPKRELILAYAYSGDVDGFIDLYKNNKFDCWWLTYSLLILFFRSQVTVLQLSDIVQDLSTHKEKYIIPEDLKSYDGCIFLNGGLKLLSMMWDAMLEEDAYKYVLNEEDSEQIAKVIKEYALVYKCLYSKIIPVTNENGMYMCLETLEKAIDFIHPYFFNGKKNFELIMEFIFNIFACHCDSLAIKYIEEYMDYMKAQYNKSVLKGDVFLIDKLKLLYVRANSTYICLYGKRNNRIEEFLNYIGVDEVPYDDQIGIRRVTKTLTPKGQIAYDSACRIYQSILNDKFGYSDAGPVSLAFYRIIESESTSRIWEPLLKSVGEEALRKSIEEQIQSISNSKQANRYRVEWVGGGKPGRIQKFIDVIDGKLGIMLGDLWYFTEFVRKNHNNDKLAEILYMGLTNVLSEEGMVAFSKGSLSYLYGKENRERFRNPPAHNKYLALSSVSACKEYVEDQLLNLNKWVKTTE